MAARDAEFSGGGAATPTCTTCPYCGVGCGVLATPDGQGGAAIAGDETHPANQGRLCSKGSALGETLSLESRLLRPEIDGAQVSWEVALDHVAGELARIREAHGPGSIAFYLSGQLLTEDYYVANKLGKGFLGTPHVDTNSRLCMASSVAGHKRAFGEDVVPQCYEDLEAADLIVLVGSNAAWCHPILFQRIQAARKARGTRVIAIDPRRTATCEGADRHLAIRPGQDSTLWNGLLVHLADNDAIDWRFVADHVEGFAEAVSAAREDAPSADIVAKKTGLSRAEVEAFFIAWRTNRRVVSVYSQGVNQSAQGSDKVNAILNCHLAAGRIGQEGCGPLSFTGQPNAMGGREVGGLANTLAAHMNFSPAERDRVARFWRAPNLVEGEGLKAVQMFDAIDQGRIKALWVMGTNPAVSLPEADRVRAALDKLELFVVSENVAANDTADRAPVRLPAAAWGEKDGTVTNSERRISRQRGFLAPAGEAKPDWWILQEVARRLGWGEAFAYDGPAAIFREHAALSGFENSGDRVFDIAAYADVSDEAFDAMPPFLWPKPRPDAPEAKRLFADGRFPTPSGRGRMLPIAKSGLAAETSADWPLRLNTGRVRDQWHTMTRTGLSPRLATHLPEPFVEISPVDAQAAGVLDGALAEIASQTGRMVARVVVTDAVAPGAAFLPIHWTAQNSSAGRAGALVASVVDPISGQPEAKAAPGRVRPVQVASFGAILTRGAMPAPEAAYWARAARPFGAALHLALAEAPADWAAWASANLPEGDLLSFEDAAKGVWRASVLRQGVLQAVAYFSPTSELPSLAFAETMFEREALAPADRRALLAGRASDAVDEGPTVCACFQVGANRIRDAIAGGCRSAEAVGAKLKAGTNCGSCVPEIRKMIAETPQAAPDAEPAAAAAEEETPEAAPCVA